MCAVRKQMSLTVLILSPAAGSTPSYDISSVTVKGEHNKDILYVFNYMIWSCFTDSALY